MDQALRNMEKVEVAYLAASDKTPICFISACFGSLPAQLQWGCWSHRTPQQGNESQTSSQWDCHRAIGSPQLAAEGVLGIAIWKDVCNLPPSRPSLGFTPCPPSLDLEVVDVRAKGRKKNQTFLACFSVTFK